MNTRFTVALIALAILALLLTAQLGALPFGNTQDFPVAGAYATFNQEPFKSINAAADSEDVIQIAEAVREAAPQIVLCSGTSIAVAVKNSLTYYVSENLPGTPIEETLYGNLWVSAFLGSNGSTPPAYRIHAIEVTGQRIRVSYGSVESAVRTCDLLTYLMWAPVGPLPTGSYTLELFDATEGTVVASRTCHVLN